MKAIYKRELQSYFNSMTGWIFIAVLMAFIGIYFMAYNLMNGSAYFSYALSAVLFLFMVLVPLLTMRSMAEERHSRTDQLLLTSPASITTVVMGKYLAMMTVLLIPVLVSCLCPLIIKLNGSAFLLADYGTLLAFFLLGGVQIALGLLISALTESQLIAAVGTFSILLVLYLWDGLVSFLPTSASGSLAGLLVLLVVVCFLLDALSSNWKITAGVGGAGIVALLGTYFYDSSKFDSLMPDLLGSFSLTDAFTAFAMDHVFDLRGLLLYLSLIALLLFLTCQVLQKRRWN
ncbi:ABC transporter permease [Dysosmobacter sp. HCP28S3_G4]|uniref:ABC transporter permease n=1 Tax=Dysosmobacter sp. HCP28S3_G4 TaxID=3438938 RepID=UPI003F89C2D8